MEQMDTETKKRVRITEPDEVAKRPRILMEDIGKKDSLFVYKEDADVEDPDKTNVDHMCELMGITTKSEWDFWVAKRLDETSTRAVNMLRTIATNLGLNPKRCKSQTVLHDMIAAHYKAE